MSKYSHNVVLDKNLNTPWYKIMKWMGENEQVLDVGCSSGYFGEKLMATHNSKIWGIDLDDEDAKKAKSVGYQEVYVGDLDTFNWSLVGDKKFDSIIFADVLEHLKNPLMCLLEVKKLLKPNGTIYASIPNIAHITVRMELFEGNFDYEDTGLLDNTHISFFTKKTIWKMFNDAGMTIVHDDRTLNDVPDGQVKNHLKNIGLNPTPSFNKLLSSNEARTFQYIIGAKITGANRTHAKTPNLTSKLKDDWPIIEKKMHDDDKTIQALRSELDIQKSETQKLRNEYSAMKKNPALWLIKKSYNKFFKNNG